ncbi:hypothetical protein KAFR_0K01440 [Kazachstania africana CBS 2517]|uniref:Mitochondrial import receptor subunit TOM20 n=1 Tax=Kazachstania africana (strain ATCC 22294 / BCRC 22015 / CBS 2517 / CECT 1963 / NBRC 1671 / NRRL Y-8276) TaxID=1071382 RepID=H2B1J8_KAZAF|nr:hypothetical protein KAFR_0K01440 [Kazachstania africana CBS 2517]CCF60498.1 hypothetical protein KAFR_0K01440 [Kazachstania africana CBS 2517]
MSESRGLVRALGMTAAVAVASFTGYALYFDHKRRSDPQFRRELKNRVKKQRQQEKLNKEAEQKLKVQKVTDFLTEELVKDPVSTDPSQRETVFTSNIEQGERLSMIPGNEMEAAAKFYKALTVYPNPADLLGIYQRSVPDNVYEFIVLMIAVLPPTNVSSFLNGGASKNEPPIISEIDE